MERPNSSSNSEQLPLLDTQNEDSEFEALDDSWLEGDFGLDKESDRTHQPAKCGLKRLTCKHFTIFSVFHS
ncbi:hypothetical protein PN498_14170 [Oscillatoria sp. CS-180]|nr:hypothetical protein [Oscillatoria sp. CS-180]